jgi:hypothetical protein
MSRLKTKNKTKKLTCFEISKLNKSYWNDCTKRVITRSSLCIVKKKTDTFSENIFNDYPSRYFEM